MLNNIYLIVGRSGTGKTTVASLLERGIGLKTVSSYTTRPPRYDGEQGHTFVTKEEFDTMTMVAYTKFNGYEYGVPAKMIDESDLYVIDIAGIEFLKKKYQGKPIKTVLLKCSRDCLKDRMLHRGDTEEQVEKRLKNDDIMFATEDTFPFDVVIDAGKPVSEVATALWQYIDKTEG